MPFLALLGGNLKQEEEWTAEIGDELPGAHGGTLPLILSRGEVRGLLESAPREAALALRTLYAGGLRARELEVLDRSDLSGQRLRLPGRVVWLDAETATVLGQREGRLFPSGTVDLQLALERAAPTLAQRFRSLGRRLTPAALRHACAVHCLENGLDALALHEQLGGLWLANTLRYLDAAVALRGTAYAEHHPLMIGQRAPAAWGDTSVELMVGQAEEPPPPALRLLDRAVPSLAEVRLLLARARSDRDRLLLQTMYSSSLRVSELIALRPGDVNGEEGKLFVRQGKGGCDRYVLVDPNTAEALGQMPAGKLPEIFGLRDVTAVQRLVDRLARECQLAEGYLAQGRRLSPHSFRHAFATHCYRSGMSPAHLRALLGHDSLKTTLLYVDYDFNHYREVFHRCQA